MAALIHRRAWNRQPEQVSLDTSHRLCPTSYLPLFGGLDAHGSNRPSLDGGLVGTSAFSDSRAGILASFDGSSYYQSSSNNTLITDHNTPFTMAWVEVTGASAPQFAGVFSLDVLNAAKQFICLRSNTAGGYEFVVGSTSTGLRWGNASDLGASVGVPHRWVLIGAAGVDSTTTTNWTLYQDGVSLGNPTTIALALVAQASHSFGWDRADSKWKGNLGEFAFWNNRLLNAAEVGAYYANPYRFLKRRRRLYFGVAAAGGNTIAVPKGSLVLTTKAPTVTGGQSNYIAVPKGSLVLTTKAPTISNSSNQTIAVPKGSLTLTAKTPTVIGGQNNTVAVPKGSLALTGKTPTVSTTHNNLIAVPAATLTLTALAPTILGATAVARGITPAGGIGGQKRRRKFVELDGKLIEVRSQKEAIQAIRAFAKREIKQAEVKVARAVAKAAIRSESVEIAPPEIAVSPDLAPSIIPQIETIRLDLNRAYEAAFIAMQQAMEDDDEDALMALLH